MFVFCLAESELLGGQKAPPLPQMAQVKTAAELEANIRQRIGLQTDPSSSSSSHHANATEPRSSRSPPPTQPQQPQPDVGEMSAFKKFVSFLFFETNGIHRKYLFIVDSCYLLKSTLFFKLIIDIGSYFKRMFFRIS